MSSRGNDSELVKPTLLGRLILVYLGLAVWISVLVVRLFFLQVVKGPEFRAQAERQQQGVVRMLSRRGDILDRNLEELAVSVEVDSIFSHPHRIEDAKTAATQLASILDVDEHSLYRKLTADEPFVYLKRKVTPRQSTLVHGLELPGIHSENETRRAYLNQTLAAHILGFVGIDNKGLSGLEYEFNEQLRGRVAEIAVKLDAHRTRFQRSLIPTGTKGDTLVLTIDRTIQHITERVLGRAVTEHGAAAGTAVIMEPDSGEILAMASFPTFNPNQYGDYASSARRNRAILDNYEPGSTFKLITVASVIDQGLASLDEIVDCRVGTAVLAGKVFREAKETFEDLTVKEILARSSNVGAVRLGLRLDEAKLYEYIRRFGFGDPTGIELPGEESGLLRAPSQWSRISIGSLSIGQEIAVTALQMLRAFAVFANGGYLVKPRIVKQILTPEGTTVERSSPARHRILQKNTVAALREALISAVEEGTGLPSRLSGFSSAGKTGTAQKIVNGRYSRTAYVASFGGFAPARKPRLAGIVVIDEPRNTIYGGPVAGPAFKEIMERALIHLGVSKDRPASDPIELAGAGPSPSGNGELPAPYGVSVIDGTADADLEPDGGLPARAASRVHRLKQGTISIDLSFETVPNFAGMTLREAARAAARLNLSLRVNGSGVAVGQRPAPGSPVQPNTICEVFFSLKGTRRSETGQVAVNNP